MEKKNVGFLSFPVGSGKEICFLICYDDTAETEKGGLSMQIFNPESKFSQCIYAITDYVKLGLVFLLFSIPGITAGAAAAAVTTVGMRIERKEAPVIFRPFWQAFKDNFRQGTVLTLLFMAVFGFLAADWYILGQVESTGLIRVVWALIFVLALLAGCLSL